MPSFNSDVEGIVTLKAYLIRVDVDLVVINFQTVKNLLKWLYFLGAQMQQKGALISGVSF